VQATRSIWTRSSGGKNGWASAAFFVEDRFDAALQVSLPQIPNAHPTQAGPLYNLNNALTSIKRE
jgi:hypothetical protein